MQAALADASSAAPAPAPAAAAAAAAAAATGWLSSAGGYDETRAAHVYSPPLAAGSRLPPRAAGPLERRLAADVIESLGSGGGGGGGGSEAATEESWSIAVPQ